MEYTIILASTSVFNNKNTTFLFHTSYSSSKEQEVINSRSLIGQKQHPVRDTAVDDPLYAKYWHLIDRLVQQVVLQQRQGVDPDASVAIPQRKHELYRRH